MFYRDTIIAGRTKLVSLRAVTRTYEKGQKRKPKSNPTPEAVAKLNFRNSVKALTAKLNHNFQPGDYLLTLTTRTLRPKPKPGRIWRDFCEIYIITAKKET